MFRRIGPFIRYAFGPARALPNAVQWAPTVIAGAALLLGLIGLSVPQKVHVARPWAVAIAAAMFAVLFLIAAFRLWLDAHPTFPNHRIVFAPLWALDHPERQGERLIICDVEFTNREKFARTHLTIDLYWILDGLLVKRRWRRDKMETSLGPYRFFPFQRVKNPDVLLDRPADVAPMGRAAGLLAFEHVSVPALKVGDQAEPITRATEQLRVPA